MEIIRIEGEDGPRAIYKPYVYATVYDCGICYAIDNGKEVKLIGKDEINKKKKNRR